ncbi:MAG: hypothetical protein ACFFG0_42300 [Candidatus Thorarchaeota archaeon]
MNNRMACIFVIWISINSVYLNCQSQRSFWEKWKYSIEIVYLEDKYYQTFIKVTKKNNGNRVFEVFGEDDLWTEILNKCEIKSEEKVVHHLYPDKLLYKRLVRDVENNKPVCISGYKKENSIFFIRLDIDFNEDDEIGFVPYICFIRLPPFKLPKGVGFFEYLKKNEYIKAYIYKRETFFEKKKEYKFKMDENGVIWVFYRD